MSEIGCRISQERCAIYLSFWALTLVPSPFPSKLSPSWELLKVNLRRVTDVPSHGLLENTLKTAKSVFTSTIPLLSVMTATAIATKRESNRQNMKTCQKIV
jgi:hypothetical protein